MRDESRREKCVFDLRDAGLVSVIGAAGVKQEVAVMEDEES